MMNLSLHEKLDLAIKSTEEHILKMLLMAPEMLVRRALLRNDNVTTNMINKLAHDVTQNVSYKALIHPRCTITRDVNLEDLRPCVKCNVDERQLSCENCVNNKPYSV